MQGVHTCTCELELSHLTVIKSYILNVFWAILSISGMHLSFYLPSTLLNFVSVSLSYNIMKYNIFTARQQFDTEQAR